MRAFLAALLLATTARAAVVELVPAPMGLDTQPVGTTFAEQIFCTRFTGRRAINTAVFIIGYQTTACSSGLTTWMIYPDLTSTAIAWVTADCTVPGPKIGIGVDGGNPSGVFTHFNIVEGRAYYACVGSTASDGAFLGARGGANPFASSTNSAVFGATGLTTGWAIAFLGLDGSPPSQLGALSESLAPVAIAPLIGVSQ